VQLNKEVGMNAHGGNVSLPVKPILRWPGGKRHLLKKLIPLIPPHVCYVEAFSGGLAVLLAKEPSTVEIVNDLNNDLITLYRCAQFHLPELEREIGWHLAGRTSIKDYRQDRGLTDIQRAARFLVRNRTSFGGDGNSFGIVRTAGGGNRFDLSRVVPALQAFRVRLNSVALECLPYERCLELYDSAETCFFLDPPYQDAPTGMYAGWDAGQLAAFAARVRSLKGSWIVTLNDSDLIRRLFKGCNLEAVVSHNRLGNNRTNPGRRMGELIITPIGQVAEGRCRSRHVALSGAVPRPCRQNAGSLQTGRKGDETVSNRCEVGGSCQKSSQTAPRQKNTP
jgi:DNA adenine methylase